MTQTAYVDQIATVTNGASSHSVVATDRKGVTFPVAVAPGMTARQQARLIFMMNDGYTVEGFVGPGSLVRVNPDMDLAESDWTAGKFGIVIGMVDPTDENAYKYGIMWNVHLESTMVITHHESNLILVKGA